MDKMTSKLLALFIIIYFLTGDVGSSAEYISMVDGNKGFNRVVDNNGNPVPYENYTLNINIGDIVIWRNSDKTNNKITIISEQNLWKDKDAALPQEGKIFKYTFRDAGVYTFYIKQYEKLPKQTIVVSDMSQYASVPTNNVTNNGTNNSGADINSSTVDNNATDVNSDETYIGEDVPTVDYTANSNTGNPPNDTYTEKSSSDVIDIDETNSSIVDIYTEKSSSIATNISDTDSIDNMTNMSNKQPVNPIIVPLDIMDNLKITATITFVIVAIILFIRE